MAKKKNNISLKSIIDYDIYTEYCNFYTMKIEKLGRALLIYVVGVIVVVLGQLAFNDFQFFVYFYIFLGIFYVLIYLFRNNEMKKYYESSKKFLEQEVKYEFLEDEINVTSKLENSHLPYEMIYKVAVTNNAIYIFINKKQAHIIDKKLNKESDILTVCEILESKTKYESYIK